MDSICSINVENEVHMCVRRKYTTVKTKHVGVGNIKMDLSEKMEWYELDCSCSGHGPVESFCKHDNQPSGSI
jgi:hypothetical protein